MHFLKVTREATGEPVLTSRHSPVRHLIYNSWVGSNSWSPKHRCGRYHVTWRRSPCQGNLNTEYTRHTWRTLDAIESEDQCVGCVSRGKGGRSRWRGSTTETLRIGTIPDDSWNQDLWMLALLAPGSVGKATLQQPRPARSITASLKRESTHSILFSKYTLYALWLIMIAPPLTSDYSKCQRTEFRYVHKSSEQS